MTLDKKSLVIVIIIVSVSVIGALAWLLARHSTVKDETAGIPLIELNAPGDVQPGAASPGTDGNLTARFFIPSETGMSEEQKNVPYSQQPVKMAEAVITEYLKGLKTDLKNAKLRGVYRDRENVVYIDLSDDFSRNFAGGARQEYYLLKSLYETITVNVVGTSDVKLLIEGKETESIGGHFYCLYGLKDTVSN